MLSLDAVSFIIKGLIEQKQGVYVVVTKDSLSAYKLEQNLKFFLAEKSLDIPLLSFPDWETLPYDRFSPHQDIISTRIKTLYQLSELKQGILVVSSNTLMHRLCPKSYILGNTFLLRLKDKLDLSLMRLRLEQSGYRCVSEVIEHGEFAVRGSILDLFPMGSNLPFRIDLFDNEIDSIRTFDVDSQRTLEKVSEIRLLPAREFPLTQDAITHFRTSWRNEFEGDPAQSPVYMDVTEGLVSQGLEYYLPLFFDHTETLLDYLPEYSNIIKTEGVNEELDNFWRQIKERFDQYGHDRLRPLLPPKEIFIPPNELLNQLKKFNMEEVNKNTLFKELQALPDLSSEPRHTQSLHRLNSFINNFIQNFAGRILFTTESLGRKENFKELLLNIKTQALDVETFSQFVSSDIKLGITVAPLEEGLIVDFEDQQNIKISIIPEAVILGKKVLQTRRRALKQKTIDADYEIRNLAELTEGNPVVHLDHGIGRYLGLTHLVVAGLEGEFVTLEYAGGDKLYVPVTSLHLISRYSGVDLEHAPLHRLGSDHWQKIKHKVLEQTRDVAAELLEIYAKREIRQGFAFKKPEMEYQAFSGEFPFEETPDQQKAIAEVVNDLTTAKPMDRVICGDVGFGKTEVAMRAAFIAVSNNKQVAVLVPTTLLAQQHFQTFTDRFANFPIKIELLSRFRTKKEQEAIIEKVKNGQIDILIGTHKILQSEINFKNLGLLIIDEEHRFGVRQKETFKALRAEVDILTLTATPIPRTLNMAMSKMRDLSLIATPPLRRLSIKTFVREKSNELIQEAILREISRGGQVFYLYNEVETIENAARELEKLVPQARVNIAHGQMRERLLEQVMSDFYHQRFNVLVCTTIIETGIDIPTANTIIIERADKFGLAQLHQLRGRVGRSHHQAYAFCLIPTAKKLTRDAEKRLMALESLEDLGAGFTLATHDLEIRGAGELLGDEQSGNINSVGFSLFMELLDEAVKLLRQGKTIDAQTSLRKNVEINLQIPAIIPESYLPDVHSRLVLYKRIASSKTKEKLKDLKMEMIDRFGLLPPQTENLFKITEIRLLVEPMGIIKIEVGAGGGRIEFDPQTVQSKYRNQNQRQEREQGQILNININKIIELIQKQPQIYQLEGPQKLKFKMNLADKEVRINEVFKLINEIKK